MGDGARLVRLMMQRSELLRRRLLRAGKHRLRPQRDAGQRDLVVAVVAQHAERAVGVLVDRVALLAASDRNHSMWQLEVAATSASSGSTPAGSDSGTGTDSGDDEAGTRAPPSNTHSCARR